TIPLRLGRDTSGRYAEYSDRPERRSTRPYPSAGSSAVISITLALRETAGGAAVIALAVFAASVFGGFWAASGAVALGTEATIANTKSNRTASIERRMAASPLNLLRNPVWDPMRTCASFNVHSNPLVDAAGRG